jgi:hypothetical protein
VTYAFHNTKVFEFSPLSIAQTGVFKEPLTRSQLTCSQYVVLTWKEIEGRSPFDDFAVLIWYDEVHGIHMEPGTLPNTPPSTIIVVASTSASGPS